jgi:hypothetical protein
MPVVRNAPGRGRVGDWGLLDPVTFRSHSSTLRDAENSVSNVDSTRSEEVGGPRLQGQLPGLAAPEALHAGCWRIGLDGIPLDIGSALSRLLDPPFLPSKVSSVVLVRGRGRTRNPALAR